MNVDQIDLSTVKVFAAPKDVASWPVTRRISKVSFGDGVNIEFDQPLPQAWKFFPDPVHEPGGNWQYTVWPVVKVNGEWVTSGIVQMWEGRGWTGAPILTEFAHNWVYDGRWGPLAGYQPYTGEQFGFFVTAGNGRGTDGVTSVRERSNVVVVPLSAQGAVIIPYGDTPAPQPTDPPVVPPQDPGVLEAIAALKADFDKAFQALNLKVDALSAAHPAPRYIGSVFGARVVLTPEE
jgi:hypothetical protein